MAETVSVAMLIEGGPSMIYGIEAIQAVGQCQYQYQYQYQEQGI